MIVLILVIVRYSDHAVLHILFNLNQNKEILFMS